MAKNTDCPHCPAKLEDRRAALWHVVNFHTPKATDATFDELERLEVSALEDRLAAERDKRLAGESVEKARAQARARLEDEDAVADDLERQQRIDEPTDDEDGELVVLEDMTKPELIAYAAEAGVDVKVSWTKAQILEAIEQEG